MTTTNNMTVSYDGKVAIVTGGASGMGAAVARLIVASGGSVVIADINEAAGAAVAAELGRRARFLRVDVTSFEDVLRSLLPARSRLLAGSTSCSTMPARLNSVILPCWTPRNGIVSSTSTLVPHFS